MPKMTIEEAAANFAISKEAIHNRIRRGSLACVVEDGIKFVMVDNNQTTSNKVTQHRANRTQARPSVEEKYYKFFEEQNSKLEEKIAKLESETRTLREQKEEMLIQERIRIEQIYKEKDEQLKNILTALSAQFMLNTPPQASKAEHVEAEIEISNPDDELLPLNQYLKKQHFSKKKREKLKAKFKTIAKNDERVITRGEKYYINTAKYDYSDLFL